MFFKERGAILILNNLEIGQQIEKLDSGKMRYIVACTSITVIWNILRAASQSKAQKLIVGCRSAGSALRYITPAGLNEIPVRIIQIFAAWTVRFCPSGKRQSDHHVFFDIIVWLQAGQHLERNVTSVSVTEEILTSRSL